MCWFCNLDFSVETSLKKIQRFFFNVSNLNIFHEFIHHFALFFKVESNFLCHNLKYLYCLCGDITYCDYFLVSTQLTRKFALMNSFTKWHFDRNDVWSKQWTHLSVTLIILEWHINHIVKMFSVHNTVSGGRKFIVIGTQGITKFWDCILIGPITAVLGPWLSIFRVIWKHDILALRYFYM